MEKQKTKKLSTSPQKKAHSKNSSIKISKPVKPITLNLV
jgi:hypothetical protein